MQDFLAEAGKIWDSAVVKAGGIPLQHEIELQSKLLNVFAVGDFFYYIFNVRDVCYDFVSAEVKQLLGLEPEEVDVPALLNRIHPDDHHWFLNFEAKVVEFFSQLRVDQIPKYKFRYDFRMRKANGEYMRVLMQVITIGHNEDGSVIRTLGIITDITYLKAEGRPVLSFIGTDGEPSYIDVDVKQVFSPTKPVITKREKEILDLLIQGKQSKAIAEQLFISRATVDKHRNNILAKTNTSNTPELVAFSIRKGWV